MSKLARPVLAAFLVLAGSAPALATPLPPQFAAPVPFVRGGAADILSLGTADTDHDGAADLLATYQSPFFGSLLYRGIPGLGLADSPAQTFSGISQGATYTSENVLAGNFTGSGRDSIMYFDTHAGQLKVTTTGMPGVTCNCGTPVATLPADHAPVHAYGRVRLAGGDLDGDGYEDVVVGDDANSELLVYRGHANDLDTPLTFERFLTLPSTGTFHLTDVTLGDYYGNGEPTIWATTGNQAVASFHWLGGWSFNPGSQNLMSASYQQQALTADLTGDGIDDLILVDPSDNRVRVLPSGGSFPGLVTDLPVTAPTAVAAGDFNADGRQDLVAAPGDGSAMHIYDLDDSGTSFTDLGALGLTTSSSGPLTAGDFNGDGSTDLVSGDGTNLDFVANAGVAVIAVAPTGAQDLGTQALDTVGAPQVLTIADTGAAPLRVTSVRSDSDDFLISGEDCVGQTVAPGDTCQVHVRFAPTATGARNGHITLAGNLAQSAVVLLTGTGGALPAGPAGTDGTNGADGQAGATGAVGATGATGAAGPTGPSGPTGAGGPAGKNGKNGKNAKVTCRVRGRRITCKVRYVSQVRVVVRRVRAGAAGGHALRAGRYRLTVIAARPGRRSVSHRVVRVR